MRSIGKTGFVLIFGRRPVERVALSFLPASKTSAGPDISRAMNFGELLGLNDDGDQGEVPAAPSTAKVWYLAYLSPMARTCTYAGSFRQAWSASMLGYM